MLSLLLVSLWLYNYIRQNQAPDTYQHANLVGGAGTYETMRQDPSERCLVYPGLRDLIATVGWSNSSLRNAHHPCITNVGNLTHLSA